MCIPDDFGAAIESRQSEARRLSERGVFVLEDLFECEEGAGTVVKLGVAEEATVE